MTPAGKPARQQHQLTVLLIVLVVGATLVATLAKKIPLPLRLLIAATDLVAAAFLWIAMRQQSAKK